MLVIFYFKVYRLQEPIEPTEPTGGGTTVNPSQHTLPAFSGITAPRLSPGPKHIFFMALRPYLVIIFIFEALAELASTRGMLFITPFFVIILNGL